MNVPLHSFRMMPYGRLSTGVSDAAGAATGATAGAGTSVVTASVVTASVVSAEQEVCTSGYSGTPSVCERTVALYGALLFL